MAFRALLPPSGVAFLFTPTEEFKEFEPEQGELVVTANPFAAVQSSQGVGLSLKCTLTLPFQFVAKRLALPNPDSPIKSLLVKHARWLKPQELLAFVETSGLRVVACLDHASSESYEAFQDVFIGAPAVVVYPEYSRVTDQSVFAADYLRAKELAAKPTRFDLRVHEPSVKPPSLLSFTRCYRAYMVEGDQVLKGNLYASKSLAMQDNRQVFESAQRAAREVAFSLPDARLAFAPETDVPEDTLWREQQFSLKNSESAILSEDMARTGATAFGKEQLSKYLTLALFTMPVLIPHFVDKATKNKFSTARDVVNWFHGYSGQTPHLRGGVPVALDLPYNEVERLNFEWNYNNLPFGIKTYEWTRKDQSAAQDQPDLASIAARFCGFSFKLPLSVGCLVVVTHDCAPNVLAGHVGTVVAFELKGSDTFPVVSFSHTEHHVLVVPITLVVFSGEEELVHVTQVPLKCCTFLSLVELEARPLRGDLAFFNSRVQACEPCQHWAFKSDPEEVRGIIECKNFAKPHAPWRFEVATAQLHDPRDAGFAGFSGFAGFAGFGDSADFGGSAGSAVSAASGGFEEQA